MQQIIELLLKALVRAGFGVGSLEFLEWRDECFRHVAAAEGTVAPTRIWHALWRCARHAALWEVRTARMKFTTSSGFFLPGFVSTPLQTSTAYGLAERIASETFSGVRPPARKMWPARFARSAMFQRKVLPLPPRRRRSKPSSKNAETCL